MSMIGNQVISTDFPVDYASGTGSQTAFTLSIAPASVNAVDVEVSGVSQSPQTYTLSGTTLTFSAAPPSGTNNIVFKHRGIAGSPNVPATASVTSASLAAQDLTINGLTVGKGGGADSVSTAVGSAALATNSSGVGNSAFGRNALTLNTTGSANTAVGRNSLLINTTGSYNIAVGNDSLGSNTTASNNTAVGYQAGYSNTTGASNTYFGYQAGYTANGSNNVSFGRIAGYSLTTGNTNTFLGDAAGYYVTSGTSNTILGRYNGNQGGLDIRTASNYIVLSDGDGNPREYFDGSGNRNTYCQGTSAGVKPAYDCRAWVNFNGTGTPAIRGSGNVSSITDNGTGLFTANYTTAITDGNYATQVTTRYTGSGDSLVSCIQGSSYSTSSVAVRIMDSGFALKDPTEVSIAIFR